MNAKKSSQQRNEQKLKKMFLVEKLEKRFELCCKVRDVVVPDVDSFHGIKF